MGDWNSTSPCASCRLLRRRCTKDCVFAPYFPPDDPRKFAILHKIFGASNLSKMLQELPIDQREDAVSSLVYEANARMRDPVYGCVGAISFLQKQVSRLEMQLAMALARAELLSLQIQQAEPAAASTTTTTAGSFPIQAHEDDVFSNTADFNNTFMNSNHDVSQCCGVIQEDYSSLWN